MRRRPQPPLLETAPRRRPYARAALLAAASTFAAAGVAQAQDAIPKEAVESVTTLAQMIRWGGLVASAVVITAASITLGFLDRITTGVGASFAEYRLTIQKISAFTRFGIYFTTIVIVVMLSFRISHEVLAILGGTAAVAIGFAMKDLVSSIVAGVMIMFDRPFQVGDRVTFGGQYGDIQTIGLRSVKLRTLDDSIVTIPNNLFLNEVTSCGNYGVAHMQIVVDFLIDPDSDATRARDIVREAAATSRYTHLPSPLVVLVNQVVEGSYVALRIRLKAYVLDTQHEKSFESDITLRVLEAFRAEGIRPPAVLHRSRGEDGPPAALRAVDGAS
jgi:small-conductance mechanosensitive channel